MAEPDPRPLNADLPEVETMRRLLDEAELASGELRALSDEMVSRVQEARRDAERLIAALDEAREALSGEGMRTEPGPPEEEPAAARVDAPGSDGARMLARQMLAGGADRKAVARRLRKSFGVKNAGAIVDSVAGDG